MYLISVYRLELPGIIKYQLSSTLHAVLLSSYNGAPFVQPVMSII